MGQEEPWASGMVICVVVKTRVAVGVGTGVAVVVGAGVAVVVRVRAGVAPAGLLLKLFCASIVKPADGHAAAWWSVPVPKPAGGHQW